MGGDERLEPEDARVVLNDLSADSTLHHLLSVGEAERVDEPDLRTSSSMKTSFSSMRSLCKTRMPQSASARSIRAAVSCWPTERSPIVFVIT